MSFSHSSAFELLTDAPIGKEGGDRAAMRDGPDLGHSRTGIRPAALQARFLPLKKETIEIAAFHCFGDTLTTSGLPEAVSRKDNIGPPSVAPVEKYIAKL